MTGSVLPIVRIIDAGCDAIALKPIEEDKLFAVMGEMLGLRYSKTEVPPKSTPVANDLDLKILPPKVVNELRAAADSLDVESTQQIVKQLQENYPELAAGLDEMIHGFRFDRIAELCKTAEEGT